MTTPNNDPQNSSGLPSYSDVTSDSSSVYSSYPSGDASYNSGNVIPGKKNSLAIWALGVAILSLVCLVSILGSALAFIPAFIGIVLGAIALVRGKKYMKEDRRTGFSVTALVLSVLVFVISLGIIILAYAMFSECATIADPTAQQQCMVEKAQEQFGG